MNQLTEILKNEGKKIIEEFNLASIQGEGTSQEVADFRENVVQSLLDAFIPKVISYLKGKLPI